MQRVQISLHAFTATFVPFASLLCAALLAAETTDSLDHHRLVYTIWVALVLAGPTLAMFSLPQHRDRDYNRLLWSFAYLAYLVHFYYAFGRQYHWSLTELYEGQRSLIATSNLLLTVVWSFDIVAGWLFVAVPLWLRIEQVAVRALLLVEAVTSTLFIFHGPVRIIGAALTATVVGSALLYLLVIRRSATSREPQREVISSGV
jgi:hypothetical protein